ncbi:MAG: APC family permease [Vulcanimicrobiaceae bacterium]
MPRPAQHELRKNALGVIDAVMIGVSGTAPAYSIASSIAALVAVVGIASPGAILVGAVPMFGIALAFAYLSRWRSDAGASYAWVGRTLSPELGFLAGWSLLVASALFAVPASLPAASSTLALFAPALAQNVQANALVGAGWFVAVNLLVVLNIKVTARFQQTVTAIEVLLLLALGLTVLARGLAHPVAAFSWAWFAPLPSGGIGTFIGGMVVAVFLFWGWDVTANLNEETRAGGRTTGLGGIFGMAAILALFEFIQVAMQLVLTPKQIGDAGTNLIGAIAGAVLPQPWASLASLVVIVSVIGTLETQLIQVGRTLFSMARDRVLAARFGELHPRFATPWLGTAIVGAIGLVQFAVAAFSPTVNALMAQLINAIGLLIAFYYGLSGFACAWYYRGIPLSRPRDFGLRVAWPGLSAAFLWVVGAVQATQLAWYVDAIPLLGLLLGLVPLAYYRAKYRSEFYSAARERSRPDPVLGSDPTAA